MPRAAATTGPGRVARYNLPPMPQHPLTILDAPRLADATLLLALTGWMDGGEVSTGTVKQIMEGAPRRRRPRRAGRVLHRQLPGSMEISALFRPHVTYEDGLVTSFEMPNNEFRADVAANMAFFVGKEPNLNWPAFSDCIFDVVERLGVITHHLHGQLRRHRAARREPRMFGSVCCAACCRCSGSTACAPATTRARPASPRTSSRADPRRGDAQHRRRDPRLASRASTRSASRPSPAASPASSNLSVDLASSARRATRGRWR